MLSQNDSLVVLATNPDMESENLLILPWGRYSPSVAKPAANPGIEVRSQVRLEATFQPRVASIIISKPKKLQRNNSYKVQLSVVLKSNKFNISYLTLNLYIKKASLHQLLLVIHYIILRTNLKHIHIKI